MKKSHRCWTICTLKGVVVGRFLRGSHVTHLRGGDSLTPVMTLRHRAKGALWQDVLQDRRPPALCLVSCARFQPSSPQNSSRCRSLLQSLCWDSGEVPG